MIKTKNTLRRILIPLSLLLLSPAIASATACHATPGSYTDVDGDTVHRPVCAITRGYLS